MKYRKVLLILAVMALFAGACERKDTVCPPDSVTYTQDQAPETNAKAPGSAMGSPTPAPVEISGKTRLFDKVVHGAFCEDDWSGTVYVACDVQVATWADKPTFLDECSLSITEGTVVYVASHNNEAFYKGCSCHYTESLSE
jgi:hypothetical protein